MTSSDVLVACQGLTRIYHRTGGIGTVALRAADLELHTGSFTAVVGPSGSGKSTLLNLLAGLESPDEGSIAFDNSHFTELAPAARAKVRAKKIGFIYQAPADNLIEYLTVGQHMRLGCQMRGTPPRRPAIEEMLLQLNLTDRSRHLPRQLSGGEQQRSAIAFASVGSPKLLIADEPTGQLDHAQVDSVVAAFRKLAHHGMTVIAATHDPTVWRRADRVLRMRDGQLVEGNQ